MKNAAELTTLVKDVLNTAWATREGRVVPEASDLKLGNDAITLDGTVLYADLADSTGLVQGYKNWFAAEVYKCYLMCASELIRGNGGSITAFDGDRVMGVFIGDSRNSNAAKCALQINYAVTQIINPAIKEKYPTSAYEVKQAVGIDSSSLFVAKTGVRGDNDLVWIGRVANYAAKLCSLRDGNYASVITADVYNKLSESSKYGGDPKQDMWTKFTWQETGLTAYRSSWHWKP